MILSPLSEASGNRLVWGSVSHLREQKLAVHFQAVKSLNSRVMVQPEDKVALICLLESTTSVHLPRDMVPCDKFLLYCDYMNVVSTKMDLALRKKEDFSLISLSVAFEYL